MTFYPPSDQGPASSSFSEFDRSREAGESRRENPILLLLVGLLIGAVIGSYVSRRKRKQKDAVQAAKEWFDAAYAQLTEKLPQLVEKFPQLAEKFPQSKKSAALWCQAAFLDQARQAGKKLKWW
jgi:LPXTG-motif cell wall-anchored protein